MTRKAKIDLALLAVVFAALALAVFGSCAATRPEVVSDGGAVCVMPDENRCLVHDGSGVACIFRQHAGEWVCYSHVGPTEETR